MFTQDEIDRIAHAAEVLAAGGLVAVPTETVYGLAADADNREAVLRTFAVKGRPTNHPLIVHVAGAHALPAWTSRVTEDAKRLTEVFWPGPLTVVLPYSAGALASLAHEQCRILAEEFAEDGTHLTLIAPRHLAPQFAAFAVDAVDADEGASE